MHNSRQAQTHIDTHSHTLTPLWHLHWDCIAFVAWESGKLNRFNGYQIGHKQTTQLKWVHPPMGVYEYMSVCVEDFGIMYSVFRQLHCDNGWPGGPKEPVASKQFLLHVFLQKRMPCEWVWVSVWICEHMSANASIWHFSFFLRVACFHLRAWFLLLPAFIFSFFYYFFFYFTLRFCVWQLLDGQQEQQQQQQQQQQQWGHNIDCNFSLQRGNCDASTEDWRQRSTPSLILSLSLSLTLTLGLKLRLGLGQGLGLASFGLHKSLKAHTHIYTQWTDR